ncbi:hypothetical protein LCGC14_1699320 [marine sediment metagenome]|uniref:Uncharacterized protein n=1 Tax=marine sediment metagenome TaxID=412755 RepID=A0A0F9JZ15_9ZZZZ
MREALRRILRRADMPNAALFGADEVGKWPKDALKLFVQELRILKQTAPSKEVRCDQCERHCSIRPEIRTHPQTGEPADWFCCPDPEEEIAGFWLAPDHRRRWKVDMSGFAALLAKATKATGPVQAIVPGRVYLLGTLATKGKVWELFWACGLTWPDAPAVIAEASCLLGAAAPIVVIPSQRPSPALWRGRQPLVRPLVEIGSLGRKTLKVNMAALTGSDTLPGPTRKWLTVTQAAQQLVDDLLSPDLKKARANVSGAARRSAFTTNGKERRDRRIEQHSFNTWRLKLRDRSLDASDPVA